MVYKGPIKATSAFCYYNMNMSSPSKYLAVIGSTNPAMHANSSSALAISWLSWSAPNASSAVGNLRMGLAVGVAANTSTKDTQNAAQRVSSAESRVPWKRQNSSVPYSPF